MYIHDTLAEIAAEAFRPEHLPSHLTPVQVAAIQELQTACMGSVYRGFAATTEWWSTAENEAIDISPEQALENSFQAAADMAANAALLRNVLSYAMTGEDIYLHHAEANTNEEHILSLLFSLKTLGPIDLP